MANIVFKFTDITSTVLGSKKVKLSPFSYPSISSNNIVVGDYVTGSTDVNGSVTFSNVVSNIYKVEINGPNVVSSLFVNIPTGSATINASDISISQSLNHTVISSSANVTFRLSDIVSNPFTVKKVSLTPLCNAVTVTSGSIATGDMVSQNTDSTGSVVFTNLVPSIYQVQCISPQKVTQFNITVPSNGGNLNAKDLITVPITNTITYDPQNINSASLAYSIPAADARFAPLGSVTGSTYSITSSWANNSVNSFTAANSVSSSYAKSASYSDTSKTASYSLMGLSASYSSGSENKVDLNWPNNKFIQTADGIELFNTADGLSVFNTQDETLFIQNLGLPQLGNLQVLILDAGGNVSTSATTVAELAYVSGVTGSIQNQLNDKQNKIATGSLLSITSSNSVSSSFAVKANTSISASWASSSISASWAPSQGATTLVTASTYQITSSMSVKAISSVSSSFASSSISASYVPNKLDASWNNIALTETVTGLTMHNYASDTDVIYTQDDSTYIANLFLGNESSQTVPIIDANNQLVSSAITPSELSYLSGVTSNIQTQLNGKQSTIASGSTYQITSSVALKSLTSVSSSWASSSLSASWAPSQLTTGSNVPVTASWSNNSISASWSPNQGATTLFTASTYPITSSVAVTSSFATKALSATSSSWASSSISSSFLNGNGTSNTFTASNFYAGNVTIKADGGNVGYTFDTIATSSYGVPFYTISSAGKPFMRISKFTDLYGGTNSHWAEFLGSKASGSLAYLTLGDSDVADRGGHMSWDTSFDTLTFDTSGNGYPITFNGSQLFLSPTTDIHITAPVYVAGDLDWTDGATDIVLTNFGSDPKPTITGLSARLIWNGAAGALGVDDGDGNQLHIKSNFILQSYTKALRPTGSAAPTGSMIFQTDNTPGLRVYNGSHWVRYSETNDD